MKKYLYTLLALVMVNVNAKELSSIPSKAVPHVFSSRSNVYEKDIARAIIRKSLLHQDSYYPYAGFGLLGIEAGVAYRNFYSKFDVDLRFNTFLFLHSSRVCFSKLVMFGNKEKKEPRKYLGLGSGIGLLVGPGAHGVNIYPFLFPRIFYGVETSYGFWDFGVDVVIQEDFLFPFPDLRWGFRF